MVKRIACLLAFGLGALAQGEEPKVVVNLDGFRYPLIAARARISGDVIFESSGTAHKLVSAANPLLTVAAEGNLRKWTLPSTPDRYVIRYRFELLDTRMELQDQPIGSKFSRFWLKVFRRPTSQESRVCVEAEERVERGPSEDAHTVVIRALGRASCRQTQVSELGPNSHL